MGKREPIHLRVGADTKEEWKEAVEENGEYSSMADLIRTAVAHELGDAYGPHGGGSGGEVADTGEITTKVERLVDKVEEFDETLSHATESMYSSGAGRDEISTAVFSELPEDEGSAKSAGEIAQQLGLEKAEVAGALERLRHETNLVHRVPAQVSGRADPTYYRVQ